MTVPVLEILFQAHLVQIFMYFHCKRLLGFNHSFFEGGSLHEATSSSFLRPNS